MDAKLNQSDLISLLAKESNISVLKAEQFTKNFFDLIIEGLEQDGVVKINGLGTFKITDVASRGSVNVNTGEKIEIKGHKKLTFTPADALKDNVNQPFAMFEPVEVDDSYQPDAVENASEDDVAEEIVETISEPQSTAEESNETMVENVEESAPIEEPAATENVVTNDEITTEESVPVAAEEAVAVSEEPAPVAVQERPAEPVMVRVPQKKTAAEVKAVPVKKKKSNWIFWVFALIGFIVGVVGVNLMSRNHSTDSVEAIIDALDVAEAKNEPVIPAESIVAEAVETEPAVVDEALPAEEIEENITAENNIESPVVAEPQTEDPYTFVVVEQLASTSLKDITLADTLLYVADGELAQHTVAPNETLTKIAREYFGDKKLWPYIVKYNNIRKPDDLCSGMKIVIPRLTPKK